MSLLEALAVIVAGCAAGTINTIVGSGTMVTFPTLMAVGVPPVTANVSNSVGLVPGSLSGAIGYRQELKSQWPRVVRLGSASAIGGIAGALALLWLPSAAFNAIVPILIGLGVVLVIVQPWVKEHTKPREDDADGPMSRGGPVVWLLVGLAGVYGGYFGAAQGVLLMAILGLGLSGSLQEHNAIKNVLALIVNFIASVVFVFVADVNWLAAGLVAAGAVVGGQLGATVGRKLPTVVYRATIVVVGVTAIVVLVAT